MQQTQLDPLVKREQFAINLRSKKKAEILLERRSALITKQKEFNDRFQKFNGDNLPNDSPLFISKQAVHDYNSESLLQNLDKLILDAYLDDMTFLMEEAANPKPLWLRESKSTQSVTNNLKKLQGCILDYARDPQSTVGVVKLPFASEAGIKVYQKVLNLLKCMQHTVLLQINDALAGADKEAVRQRVLALFSPYVQTLKMLLWCLINLFCILDAEEGSAIL